MIRKPQAPQFNLSPDKFETPFFVDMESFFEFSFWISEELLDLEAQFMAKNSPRLSRELGAQAVAPSQ